MQSTRHSGSCRRHGRAAQKAGSGNRRRYQHATLLRQITVINPSSIEQQLPYKISVCGRGELAGFRNAGITHLLSIDSPGSPTATPEWFKGVHWHLAFVDVESTAVAKIFGLEPPGKNDVELILEFGKICRESSRNDTTHLVIHCLAGVSRSPGAAYAIICMLLGPGSEKAAFDHLLKIRSCASPNRLMVQYADQILRRNGAMIEAAEY